MGNRMWAIDRVPVMAVVVVVVVLSMLGLQSGCQSTASVGTHRLIEHQAMIDFAGLAPMTERKSLRVEAAIPERWDPLPTYATALYTHQQWRSPSRQTGVGVAYIHSPIPLSTNAILWFAKTEYNKKKASDGQQLGEWKDATGRHWFEAENSKYHVRGYVITKGFDAWIVYFGYRVPSIPNAAELNLAARAADKVLPTPLINRESPVTAEASAQ